MSILQKDIKLLWGRAGSRCAICHIELSHDSVSTTNSYVLGEQAHIVGESSTAARGKGSLNDEERNTYHNLILVCPTHHTEIDKNEADWTVERLFLQKSRHELWVREALEAVVDVKTEVEDSLVSAAVDDTVALLRIEEWSNWTSYALGPDPVWPDSLARDVYTCLKRLVATLWPERYDELRRSALTLVRAVHASSELFHQHAVPHGDSWRAVRFYRSEGWNENYHRDLERYKKWIAAYYRSIHFSAAAANWFADVVRKDINPRFLAEKGRFTIEEGPFPDCTVRFMIPELSKGEKATLPDSRFP